MLARGINVCIGTDSLASNESLSVLDELRFLHRQDPSLDPIGLLAMGTRNGARALQMHRVIGTLESGKYADFVVVPYDPKGSRDPIVNVLEAQATPVFVFVAGHSVL